MNMNRTAPMTMFCLDAYEPPRAMASPTSQVSHSRIMDKGVRRARDCDVRAPDRTSRHQPSSEVQGVASRQVVLLLGVAGSRDGFSEWRAGCAKHQLACAVLDGTRWPGWIGQSSDEDRGLRSKLHCGSLF